MTCEAQHPVPNLVQGDGLLAATSAGRGQHPPQVEHGPVETPEQPSEDTTQAEPVYVQVQPESHCGGRVVVVVGPPVVLVGVVLVPPQNGAHGSQVVVVLDVVPVPVVVLLVLVVLVFGHCGHCTVWSCVPWSQLVYVVTHWFDPSAGQKVGGAQLHPGVMQQLDDRDHRQAEKSKVHLHRPTHGAGVVVVADPPQA